MSRICSDDDVGQPSCDARLVNIIRSTSLSSRCPRRFLVSRSLFFWLSIFIALVSVQAALAAETAQTSSDEELQAQEFVGLLQQKSRLQAQLEFLQQEEKVLNSLQSPTRGVGETLEQTKNLDEKFRTAFKEILEGRLKEINEQLAEMPPAVQAKSLPKDFVDIRRELAEGRSKLVRARAQKDFAGQLASLLNVQNRWLWLGGLLAGLTWMGLFIHERRHELRRLRWVCRGRAWIVTALLTVAILFLLLPTVSMFALGNKTYDALVALSTQDGANELGIDPATERDVLNEEVKKLQDDVHKQEEKQSKLLPVVQQRLDQAFAQGADKPNLSGNWSLIRQKLQALYVEHVSNREIASALSASATKLADIQRLLEKEQGAIADFEKRNRLFASVWDWYSLSPLPLPADG